MTYAFDVDGTITGDAPRISEIMKSLRMGGHTVVVITGCLSHAPSSVEMRQAQLASYGVFHKEHYDNLYVCEGPDYDDVGKCKAALCATIGVDMMFEDTPAWCVFIRTLSPKTTCVLMAGTGA